jgi:hypothetical protein
MNQYLVEVAVNGTETEDFMALIPEQRVHINNLMTEGSILFFCLSIDRAKVWTGINAESEQEAIQIIESMPLSDYMTATLYELSYFNIAGSGLPAISLN